MFGNTAPFLNVALRRFREKHNVDLERFMFALATGLLFPAERLKLAREGLPLGSPKIGSRRSISSCRKLKLPCATFSRHSVAL
jgi:hypothetical protein